MPMTCQLAADRRRWRKNMATSRDQIGAIAWRGRPLAPAGASVARFSAPPLGAANPLGKASSAKPRIACWLVGFAWRACVLGSGLAGDDDDDAAGCCRRNLYLGPKRSSNGRKRCATLRAHSNCAKNSRAHTHATRKLARLLRARAHTHEMRTNRDLCLRLRVRTTTNQLWPAAAGARRPPPPPLLCRWPRSLPPPSSLVPMLRIIKRKQPTTPTTPVPNGSAGKLIITINAANMYWPHHHHHHRHQSAPS